MRLLLTLIPVAWLAACASSAGTTVAASSDGTICTREVSVGTTVAVRRCRTPAQVEADRANAERTKESIRSSVPRGSSNVPGGS